MTMQAFASRDLQYFAEVLCRPGMLRNVLPVYGKFLAIDEALLHPNTLFIEVRDESTRLGFVAFRTFEKSIAEMHTCLLTLGSRTVQALSLAFNEAYRHGLRAVVAAYPSGHGAINRLAVVFGFEDMSVQALPGYAVKLKYLTPPCHS